MSRIKNFSQGIYAGLLLELRDEKPRGVPMILESFKSKGLVYGQSGTYKALKQLELDNLVVYKNHLWVIDKCAVRDYFAFIVNNIKKNIDDRNNEIRTLKIFTRRLF